MVHQIELSCRRSTAYIYISISRRCPIEILHGASTRTHYRGLLACMSMLSSAVHNHIRVSGTTTQHSSVRTYSHCIDTKSRGVDNLTCRLLMRSRCTANNIRGLPCSCICESWSHFTRPAAVQSGHKKFRHRQFSVSKDSIFRLFLVELPRHQMVTSSTSFFIKTRRNDRWCKSSTKKKRAFSPAATHRDEHF